MKRKSTDRTYLKRVVDRTFKFKFLNDDGFTGYLTLFKINELTTDCVIAYGNKKVCVLNDGYSLLQYVPLDENYTLTAFIDDKNEIVQWYFDITYKNGLGNDGIPYYDDLYLDILVLPSLEIMLLDEDELQEALKYDAITEEQYNLAYRVANALLADIKKKNIPLMLRWQEDLKTMMEF